MKIAFALDGYQGFARRIAGEAGSRVDALMATGGRRRVRTETSDMVLGGEAWPGAVPFDADGLRR